MTGVNNIALQGDETIARKYVRQTEKLLDALRARMGDSGATVASTQLRWDDAYAYVFCGPGVSKGIITAGYPGIEFDSSQGVTDTMPDFVSGAVVDSRLTTVGDTELCAAFVPTAECASLHEISANPHPSRKLAVHPSDLIAARWPEPQNVYRPSQYARAKATMYSGKMRKVVQFISGFGRPSESIYDREPPPITRAADQPPPLGAAWEAQVIQRGRQIQYDFGFTRTHGVTVASDGRWWLVEIGIQKGVLVMPLPMNDMAATTAFREKLEAMGDEDALYAIEAMGGWPSGEPFPTGEALEMASSGGFVLTLLEPERLESFYNCTAYGSCMGWAFSGSGRQAHNTAWYMHDDGIQRGVWHAVQLTIGRSQDIDPPSGADEIKIRLAAFARNHPAYPWAVRKADRLTAIQASNVLGTSSNAALWAALLEQQCDPVASASATARRMQEGLLYWQAKQQPHIQFPEPLLGYCVSHIMKPFPSVRPLGNRRCDTAMHVYFLDEEMVVCRYFYEPRVNNSSSTSNFEDCMYVGAWESETFSSATYCPAMMYTTGNDDRADISHSRANLSIVGTDVGYYRAQVRDDLTYPVLGQLFRTKAFRLQTNGTTTIGETLRASVRVPFFDRCAHYYATARGHTSQSQYQSVTYVTLEDPQSYETWRNFGGYTHYSYVPPPGHFTTEHPADCGPVTARTVWRPFPLVITGCHDLAYEGSWASPCDNAEDIWYSRPLPESEVTVTNAPSQVSSTTYLVCEGTPQPIRVAHVVNAPDPDGAVDQWFMTSPDPETGGVQRIETTSSTLGRDESVQYDRRMNPDPQDGDILVYGRLLHSDMQVKRATYVGVIGG